MRSFFYILIGIFCLLFCRLSPSVAGSNDTSCDPTQLLPQKSLRAIERKKTRSNSVTQGVARKDALRASQRKRNIHAESLLNKEAPLTEVELNELATTAKQLNAEGRDEFASKIWNRLRKEKPKRFAKTISKKTKITNTDRKLIDQKSLPFNDTFGRDIKKLDKQVSSELDQHFLASSKNPHSAGRPKSTYSFFTSNMRVYGFTQNGVHYRIAYRIIGEKVEYLMIGAHENFYKNLKIRMK